MSQRKETVNREITNRQIDEHDGLETVHVDRIFEGSNA